MIPPKGVTGDGVPTLGPSVPPIPPDPGLEGLELAHAADRELEGERALDELDLACPTCGRRWGCRCRFVMDDWDDED